METNSDINTGPCPICAGAASQRLFDKDGFPVRRCQTCGLVWLHPQPSDEVLAKIYGAHYYGAWGVAAGLDPSRDIKKRTFARLFDQLQLPKGSKVLDCGAAFGFLMEAARDYQCEAYGIELAADAAQEIAKNFGATRVFSGPFEQATFPDAGSGSFDAICMCDFLEHVRDPRQVLAKAADLLKPGGWLVISTPDSASWSCRLMGQSWLHYKVEHLYYFSPPSLERLLRDSGFEPGRRQACRKAMNLDYVRHQLNFHPRFAVTPIFNAAMRLVPAALRAQPFMVAFGEMTMLARRK